MRPPGSRHAGLLFACLALPWGCGPACELVAGPEVPAREALRRMEAGLSLDVGAGPPLELSRVKLDRVVLKPEGEGFAALATVDADGAWGDAQVGYLGAERIPLRRGAGRLEPVEPALPGLAGVARALVSRRQAFLERDGHRYEQLLSIRYGGSSEGREAALARLRADVGSSLPRALGVRRWSIRVEGERATAREDYEVRVAGPGGEEPHRGAARFELAREGGEWRFTSGL